MDKRIFLEEEHKVTGLKVFLASMKDSHIQHLIKLAQDQSLVDLVGWNTFFQSDEIEQFIQAISSYAFPYSRKSQPLVFGVYPEVQGLPIGYVVLKGLNMDLLTTEIGVAILDKQYRYKGYGSLALKRLISYSFDELQIQTIGAAILLSNKSSINTFKKLGFVITQIMDKSWAMPNGDLVDMILMELKNST